ncbi:hypothetical protein ACFQV2_33790 [Actinokineospora soli]|uniref:Uncharacterized protein n=1 Tax=Actinokineospora soli TaxID=1048753 RepID=A0ABW2TW03_9PSEU
MPDANPYAGAFREMLAAIDYTPGMPSMMVDSLASTQEEFTERFSGLFTGRTSFLRNLDTMLDNTVAVLTTMPERADEWIAQLADRRAALLEHNPEDAPEVELVDQLATLTAGGDAALPDDHPYADQLAQVVGGVGLHRGDGPLPGAEVVRLAMLTAGAVTLYRDLHEPWVAELADLRARHGGDGELVAFLDALGVVLDGRAADLPVRNRYRSFLRMCQSQLRALTAEPPEPDPVM